MPVGEERYGHPPYIVTVTDESGAVIFVGRPSQQQDTFAIVQKEEQPTRLLCSVTDLSAELTVSSAVTEPSLETRVATAIWGYVDDYGIGRAAEVITLVRAEVAREIEADERNVRTTDVGLGMRRAAASPEVNLHDAGGAH